MHTSGPWVKRGSQVTAQRDHVCGGWNEESIFALTRPTDEVEANLRLVVAAPDMLAALKTAQAEIICLLPRLSGGYHKNMKSVFDQVTAAIKKAEARASLASRKEGEKKP